MSGIARTIKSRTVVRFPREQRQTRSYLTEAEVERLMQAVRKHGRHGHRDATMILLAFRHGLRVGELVRLQWSQVHLESATLHVQRLKHGKPSAHPLSGVELRALRRLRREQPAGSRFVFVSERGAPMTTRGFAQMLSRTARAHCVSDRGPSAHAAACLRLQARERSPGHARHLRLSRPSQYPTYGPLHRARERALRRVLAGLMRPKPLANGGRHTF